MKPIIRGDGFFSLQHLWQRYLSKDIQNKIENAFKNEMKELNYL